MKKKTVLVTGSSSGLGSSIAEKFAKNGYNVIINYLKHEKEANILKELLEKEYNIECLCIKADVSNDEDVLNMYNEVKNKFGFIDVLVNNAGIALDSEFESKTKDDFLKTYSINTYSVYLVSKTFAKDMYENKNGSIINISSTNGIDTYYEFSADYDASKAAVINLTHNLANHYSPYVRVNCVCPGWIKTPMNSELDDDFIKEESNKILLNRFAEPHEIASLVYFLSTDEARYINDSVIKIDGGQKC